MSFSFTTSVLGCNTSLIVLVAPLRRSSRRRLLAIGPAIGIWPPYRLPIASSTHRGSLERDKISFLFWWYLRNSKRRLGILFLFLLNLSNRRKLRLNRHGHLHRLTTSIAIICLLKTNRILQILLLIME